MLGELNSCGPPDKGTTSIGLRVSYTVLLPSGVPRSGVHIKISLAKVNVELESVEGVVGIMK